MPLLTDPEREPFLDNAGEIAAAVYGVPLADARQGCKQASDALRKAIPEGPPPIDGTPTDWIILSRARAGGATPAQVEKFAENVRRLQRH